MPMSAIATQPRPTRRPSIRIDRERWVSIRPIEASDADGLSAFYAALSPEARHARFLASRSGIGADAAARLAGVERPRGDGFVAELHEAGPQDGLIVGHACMEPAATGTEEIAFAVADGYRGRRIGSALMAEAVASARRRGVRHLTVAMYATNQPMRRLISEAGLPVERGAVDCGVEEVSLKVA